MGKSKSQERREAIQNADGELTPDVPKKEEKQVVLRLLKNCYIGGTLRMKGEEISYRKDVAIRKMKQTNGIFELVGKLD